MIKHWEILENKWTQGAAYVLGIEGDDRDCDLILKELASFCSLTTVKVQPFTHIFELLNVTDDDILQKIRAKIETISKKNTEKERTNSFISTPLQASKGILNFTTEGEASFDLGKNSEQGNILSSSSDGQEIALGGVIASRLEDTKTSKLVKEEPVVEQKKEIKPEEKQAEVKLKESQLNKEAKLKQEFETKKEEKKGFFRRLFSFGKAKEKPVKEEKISTPLPIEELSLKTENIITDKEAPLPIDKKEGQIKGKDTAAKETSRNMHGVVVQGTAFPVEELGAQKIKEVSLNSKSSKMLFDKEPQGEALQSQVPLDDIFAAETICRFYDEQGDSAPKIEKIEEPTPMPTPKIITITSNKILEENLKKAQLNQQEGAVPSVNQEKTEEKKPETKKENIAKKEAVPAIPKVAKKPAEPVLQPKQKETKPAAPKGPQSPKPAEAFGMPVIPVAAAIVKGENKADKTQERPVKKDVNGEKNLTDDKKESLNTDKQEKKIPQINVSKEESIKENKPAEQEKGAAALPKVEMKTADLQDKEEKSSEGQNKSEINKEDKTKDASSNRTSGKPIAMPQLKDTKIDGFDHTIQTASIPVYKKSNWPIEMPIVPSYTLDNMDMSSNRFAHAAAMSIVENPGTMYNPFFLFGEGGCGKTHFLNAVGVEFAKKLSQDKIFITNGVRFSRGVQRAIENGTIDKVKGFLDEAQVLIIDDIHLTAVNDSNREFISKVLNDFVEKRKQLVISSKYPPQGLLRFEELTNFKLSQGWISELKTLRPNHFIKAYTKMAEDAQVDLTEAQCRGFFGRENLTLGMIAKDIKRAKVLRRRIKDSGSMLLSYEQLLNYITAIAGEDTTSQIETLDLNSPLSIRRGENTNWGDFGFFFPKESADKFKWIVYATMRRAKELGIKGGFNFALKSAYSTEHIIASAFKIANVCDSKNLKAAVILGPDPKIIQPAIRDNFCDILSHMLEVMMIRCAIISHEDIKKPSSYVKILGDVLK